MINNSYRSPPPLYKHQISALDFIHDIDSFALFMEQGTGKSKVVLVKANQLYNDNLINSLVIICPNAIKDQWLHEQIEEHFPNPYAGVIWDGFKTNKSQLEFFNVVHQKEMLRVFIINVEAFQSSTIDSYLKTFCEHTEPFIIVDESTRIKNPAAKRTQKIIKGFRNRQYKCILTGTPTPNSPFDLYSQFDFLQKDFFDSMKFFHFKHHYGILLTERNQQVGKDYSKVLDEVTFKKIKNFLNKNQPLNEYALMEASVRYKTSVKNITYINNLQEYYPYKHMDELNKKISCKTFKVMKKDCLDLPDKVYEKLYIELNKEQKRLYKSLQKELTATYKGKDITVRDKMVMTMRLQMITGGLFPYSDLKIKQFIDKDGEVFEQLNTEYKTEVIENNCKIKALLEDLEEVSLDTQIIIWCHFVDEIKMVTKVLNDKGYVSQFFYGGVKKGDRKGIIEKFKNREIRILVANPLVGGEGLNLQISTFHYYYSNSYKADARLQSEDRSHRIGQTNKVTYKDIICKNTVDEKIMQALKMKKNLIDFFRDTSLEDIIY